jgi:hypothetical protein
MDLLIIRDKGANGSSGSSGITGANGSSGSAEHQGSAGSREHQDHQDQVGGISGSSGIWCKWIVRDQVVEAEHQVQMVPRINWIIRQMVLMDHLDHQVQMVNDHLTNRCETLWII